MSMRLEGKVALITGAASMITDTNLKVDGDAACRAQSGGRLGQVAWIS